MKRYTLFFAFILVTLFSCNNSSTGGEEPTPYDGLAPEIKVNDAFQLRDTIKFSVQQEYTFSFQITDDQTERYLSVSKLQEGLLFFQGKIINDTKANISGIQNGDLIFRALEAGEFSFIVTVEDEQGLTTSVVIEVNVLSNWLPIAKLAITQVEDGVSPNQVLIDGAESFDADARWGGNVTAYEYTVDNFYTTESVRSKIEYIFPEAGTYRIGLRVKDNDGEWSESLFKQISIK